MSRRLTIYVANPHGKFGNEHKAEILQGLREKLGKRVEGLDLGCYTVRNRRGPVTELEVWVEPNLDRMSMTEIQTEIQQLKTKLNTIQIRGTAHLEDRLERLENTTIDKFDIPKWRQDYCQLLARAAVRSAACPGTEILSSLNEMRRINEVLLRGTEERKQLAEIAMYFTETRKLLRNGTVTIDDQEMFYSSRTIAIHSLYSPLPFNLQTQNDCDALKKVVREIYGIQGMEHSIEIKLESEPEGQYPGINKLAVRLYSLTEDADDTVIRAQFDDNGSIADKTYFDNENKAKESPLYTKPHDYLPSMLQHNSDYATVIRRRLTHDAPPSFAQSVPSIETPAIISQSYAGTAVLTSGILLTSFLACWLFRKCLCRPKRHEVTRKSLSCDDPLERV